MTELTRRRYPERPDCWHIYYGDVHVGTIARRVGNPNGSPAWEWNCGFYPGSHPGECTVGVAATFDHARAAFETAWRVFLAKRTEADFQEWREARALITWKYKMWETGHRLPTQNTSGRSTCFCGASLAIADTDKHVRSAHMEAA